MQGSVSASATAAAQCSSPDWGSVIPIAWFCPEPEPDEEPEPGEETERICDFELFNEDYDEGEPPLYIFMNSGPISDEFDCFDPPNSLPSDDDYVSGNFDCDWDDDGVNDLLDESDRGWLDLDGGSESANQLTKKIIKACEHGEGENISNHTWVGGQPGADVSVFQTVRDSCEGKEVIIPIFDTTCDSTLYPEDDCFFVPPHPTEKWIPTDGISYYYHIVGFASFHIECVHATASDKGDRITFPDGTWVFGSRCEGRNDVQRAKPSISFTPGNPLTIEGWLIDEISPQVGGSGGWDSGTYVIYLTK